MAYRKKEPKKKRNFVTDTGELIRQNEALKDLCEVNAVRQTEQRLIIGRLAGDVARERKRNDDLAAFMAELVDAVNTASRFIEENREWILERLSQGEYEQLLDSVAIIEAVKNGE